MTRARKSRTFLSATVIYGALAAGAAFLVEILLLSDVLLHSISFWTFLIGSLIEESAKLIFLLQWYRRFVSAPITLPIALICSTLFGAGFASVELYFAFPIPITTAVSLASIHIFTSLLAGGAMLVRILPSLQVRLFLIILTINTLLHTAYNLLIASSLQ